MVQNWSMDDKPFTADKLKDGGGDHHAEVWNLRATGLREIILESPLCPVSYIHRPPNI